MTRTGPAMLLGELARWLGKQRTLLLMIGVIWLPMLVSPTST